MCREAPDEVLHLEHIGVTFHRNEQRRARTCAPSAAPRTTRTYYVADITGQAILHVLYEQLMKYHETRGPLRGVVHHLAHRSTTTGNCIGCVARDIRTGRDGDLHRQERRSSPRAAPASASSRRRTRLICTGDGIAQAYRDRRAADGHGDDPVPPDDARRERLPHHRGRPRRGRAPPQLRRRALHGEVRAQQDGARLARRRLARRADRDQRGPRRRPRRRRASTSTSPSCRASARSRRCARSSTSARTSPASTSPREPILIRPGQHYIMGGVKTDVDGADADPRPVRRRRGRLRLGPRRQPPRRELAARHADLRPPLRRARRRSAPRAMRDADGLRRPSCRDDEREIDEIIARPSDGPPRSRRSRTSSARR